MSITATVTIDIPPEQLIPGPSAYDVAVANGFVGTELEWLESLKGEPGSSQAGTSLPGVVCLADFMDARYGVGQWTKRTGVGQGTDIGPALSDALDYLNTNFVRGQVYVPPGQWLMNTAPTAAQYSGNVIFGAGSMASSIVYNNNTGAAFSFSGTGGRTGGGVKHLGLLLEDGYSVSSAYQILMQGDAAYQPDQMEFQDLYMSAIGTSYWYNGIQAYGVARTSPQGIRICDMSNIQIFRCRNAGMYLANVVQWTGRNIGVYAGQGSGNNIYVAGGGSAQTNSTQVHMSGIVCSDLNITNTTNFSFSGKAATVSTGTSDYGDIAIPGAVLQGAFGPKTRVFV